MKRLIPLALVALALAAVPAAWADGGNGNRLQQLRQRVANVSARFADRCGTSAAGAPQQCVDVAQKLVQRLQTLDSKVQQRMANRPALQKVDAGLQKLIGRLQTWLGSSATSSSASSTSDGALDNAASLLQHLKSP